MLMIPVAVGLAPGALQLTRSFGISLLPGQVGGFWRCFTVWRCWLIHKTLLSLGIIGFGLKNSCKRQQKQHARAGEEVP
jgi:hypothetical protein